jgi:hypothetical protein
MVIQDIIEAIERLHLKPEDYIVVGSGVLGALEIREVDDIDLVVSTSVFCNYESSGQWTKKQYEDGTAYLLKDMYEVGTEWDSKNGKPNLEDLKNDQVVLYNIPFASLERLKQWKIKVGREKDLTDIRLIEEYLKSQSA